MSTAAAVAPPPAEAPPRARLSGLFHAELIKLTHQRSTWLGIGAAALVFLAVVEWGGAGQDAVRALFRHDAEHWMLGVLPGVQMLFQYGSGVLLLIVAARSVGGDHASGCMRVLLARGVGRLQLLGAKLLALLCLAVLLLVAGAALTAIYFGSVAIAADGSPAALVRLSPTVWQTLGLSAVSELVSMVACTVIGLTTAVIGRSVAFGVGAAMAVFPLDSLYTQWSPLLAGLTGQHAWTDATRVLLGPNLNALSQRLRPGAPSTVPLPTPIGGVSVSHALIVSAAWVAAMLLTSAVLLRRRDVDQ